VVGRLNYKVNEGVAQGWFSLALSKLLVFVAVVAIIQLITFHFRHYNFGCNSNYSHTYFIALPSPCKLV
jgi:hypothetical protein